MDAFRSASYTLSVNKGRLQELFESVQKAPDDIFSNISAKMARVFKQPACMSQIDKQTIDGLNAAQDSLDTSEVDCSSPPGKNPR